MITITDYAAEKISELLADQDNPDLFLRVGVKEGGCSGFSYAMGLDDELQEGDTELTIHQLKVVVDHDSAKYLRGLVIDFKESAMSGGFTMDNPNATVSCGCGSSFRTATDAGNPAADPC